MSQNKQPFSNDKYQELPSKGSSLHISDKLEDQLFSILQREARLKNFGHMLPTIKFHVLIINNIDSKSKDIIAKLRLKGFSPYTRHLLQFHVPFRTLPQNYLTSLGLREDIYYTICGTSSMLDFLIQNS